MSGNKGGRIRMKLPVNYREIGWKMRRIVREEYIKLQEGKCYHCGELLTDEPSAEVMELSVDVHLFPPNFFQHPVHLHHDHNTNMTIGAVHCFCNAVLWQYFGE
jgi:hypothetical protein